ncbi:septum formation initiator family protein [Alphaproteobacteria bacterium]|nr:septum formation initiator family protein [Alphaproteobacteria bacterium]
MIRFVTSRPSSRTVGQAPLRLRRLVPSFLLLLAIAGLTMQALQGERSWRGWNNLQTEKAFLQEELDALKNQNTELRQQVELLGNNNLDLDFLDERARLVLGLVGRDETIVFKTDPRLN